MDWRERYERAAARYAAGETREPDERQLVQLANAAWAAGLSLLMAGDREDAAEWLRRSAARYRESWDAGAATDAWGRPIGAMKALLIGGDDASDAARWALDAGAPGGVGDRPVRRRVRTARPRPRRGGSALVATLGDDFPGDVAAALAALAADDPDGYRAADCFGATLVRGTGGVPRGRPRARHGARARRARDPARPRLELRGGRAVEHGARRLRRRPGRGCRVSRATALRRAPATPRRPCPRPRRGRGARASRRAAEASA